METLDEEIQKICLIKIWSWSVVKDNMEINYDFLIKLKNDIKKYELTTKEKVIILSSWAVALGKKELKDRWIDYKLYTKPQLASIWQNKLIKVYEEVFSDKIVAQILFNDELNEDRFLKRFPWNKKRQILLDWCKWLIDAVKEDSEKHIVKLLADNVKTWILSILNYNDSLSSEELKELWKKSDNDANVLYLSETINKHRKKTKMQVTKIVFLTNTRWILNKDKETVQWELIQFNWTNVDNSSIINSLIESYSKHIEVNKQSSNGTWWMISKLKNALKSLQIQWVKNVYIASSKDWLDCMENHDLSTCFEKIN